MEEKCAIYDDNMDLMHDSMLKNQRKAYICILDLTIQNTHITMPKITTEQK